MSDGGATHPHVTLILGAGGPVGRAFHAGVLAALHDACGWDARAADLIVGTSAGAQIAALLRAGWDSHRLLQRAAHLTPAPVRGSSRPWPTSRPYLRAVAGRPWLARLGPVIAALMPEGTNHAEHLGDTFHHLFAWHWPHRPMWIPAIHVDSGARIVFGRDDAPRVDVSTAVRSSSAVPGLRRPVEAAGSRFVDGGVGSPTHADLAAHVDSGDRHRVVVVLSPLSRFWPLRLLLRWELRAVVRHGVDVVLFEPDREVEAAMGWNPMDFARAPIVTDAAYRAARRRLREPDVAATLRSIVGA